MRSGLHGDRVRAHSTAYQTSTPVCPSHVRECETRPPPIVVATASATGHSSCSASGRSSTQRSACSPTATCLMDDGALAVPRNRSMALRASSDSAGPSATPPVVRRSMAARMLAHGSGWNAVLFPDRSVMRPRGFGVAGMLPMGSGSRALSEVVTDYTTLQYNMLPRHMLSFELYKQSGV